MSEKPFDFDEWIWEFIRQSFNKIGREYEENMKRFQGENDERARIEN